MSKTEIDHLIDFNDITEFRKSYKKSLLLIEMYRHMPRSLSTKILETQINCLHIKEMNFPTKLDVEQCDYKDLKKRV